MTAVGNQFATSLLPYQTLFAQRRFLTFCGGVKKAEELRGSIRSALLEISCGYYG